MYKALSMMAILTRVAQGADEVIEVTDADAKNTTITPKAPAPIKCGNRTFSMFNDRTCTSPVEIDHARGKLKTTTMWQHLVDHKIEADTIELECYDKNVHVTGWGDEGVANLTVGYGDCFKISDIYGEESNYEYYIRFDDADSIQDAPAMRPYFMDFIFPGFWKYDSKTTK